MKATIKRGTIPTAALPNNDHIIYDPVSLAPEKDDPALRAWTVILLMFRFTV